MHLDTLRTYCLAKPATTEDMPFGDDVLVFRVRGKMFALTNIAQLPTSVNLKCDPERAIELRERHAAVQPGYHMNKQHWNTIVLDGSLDARLVRDLIDHSYQLVVARLPKRDRAGLEAE